MRGLRALHFLNENGVFSCTLSTVLKVKMPASEGLKIIFFCIHQQRGTSPSASPPRYTTGHHLHKLPSIVVTTVTFHVVSGNDLTQ